MRSGGWKPFWAALFASLLVLVPLVGGTVLLSRQQLRTQLRQAARSESGVPIQLPKTTDQLTVLLCVSGEQPGFVLAYLNASQNCVHLLSVPAVLTVPFAEEETSLARCYAAAGPARCREALAQVLALPEGTRYLAFSPDVLGRIASRYGPVRVGFTGALTDKTGAFVEANGGTIFLDEIGNLSYEVQIQLLRALQERKIRPVGSNKEISVDVRLVSATNENLEQAIEKGAFREDLYHRINEFTLRMPQLKDRREDILLFANFFLDQANREMDKQLTGFDDKASRALLEYPWPGNLRQMKNMVRRATLLAQGKFITINELNELKGPAPGIIGIPLRNEEAEKHQIIEALRQTGNNKSRAAQLLGIDRKTLYNKLKLYNISD